MRIVVTYDVCTETREGQKRLRKAALTCLNFGQRVQKSVFECTVTDAQYEELRRQLVGLIDQNEDSLRLYRLPEGERQHVEHFGKGASIDFDGPLVV